MYIGASFVSQQLSTDRLLWFLYGHPYIFGLGQKLFPKKIVSRVRLHMTKIMWSCMEYCNCGLSWFSHIVNRIADRKVISIERELLTSCNSIHQWKTLENYLSRSNTKNTFSSSIADHLEQVFCDFFEYHFNCRSAWSNKNIDHRPANW